mgnify:CR=1 FL=1
MLEKDRDIIAAPYPMKFINPNSVYKRMKEEGFKNDKDFQVEFGTLALFTPPPPSCRLSDEGG